MSDRFDAEKVIKNLTGGQVPRIGTTIIFTGKGWQFIDMPGEPGDPYEEREFVISEDPVDPAWAPSRVGSLWLQVEPEV